jgi:hypothetical protein
MPHHSGQKVASPYDVVCVRLAGAEELRGYRVVWAPFITGGGFHFPVKASLFGA